ncbi:Putative inner membrane protein [Geoalkalibacter ferrihydriticus]|uniref:DUF1819 domain-containing protein n=2 Tax=Geoalkalibacter ferrihydriticus TaxID=392333 RepID=A0A0C2HMS9_9BACT|nr:BrxA family protein [Geoalkalibacter ferrihydriticus]KIH76250.1 hypothetical protein GFER_11565 [Geoalkalibacter ferrihydriticus DSM 17813]SDL24446.1 Putative inner membrane protein [Geoalkalibacter ferrihydriticus]
MHADERYTTQLQAGLGMIPETMDLLRLWEPGMIPSHLADRAVEEGLFSRATARRTRNLVAEMFAPRYLVEQGAVASRLKFLLEQRFPSSALTQVFYLQTARAQRVFADFVIEVYWPKYMAGALSLVREDAESFIHRALDAGKMQKRWSETTIKRISGYLLGCCVDFGLLENGRGKERRINRFSIRSDVALYLAYDLHLKPLSDMSVVHHPDWRLFGLNSQEVIRLLKTLSHDGHLLIQSTADLVQISWKYRSMEECLNALTQR